MKEKPVKEQECKETNSQNVKETSLHVHERKVTVILKSKKKEDLKSILQELLSISCDNDADFQEYSLKNPAEGTNTTIVLITGYEVEKLQDIYLKVVNLKF